MRRIKSEPLTFIGEVYGRLVHESDFDHLMSDAAGLENFHLFELCSHFDQEVMRGTSDHILSSEGRVDVEVMWQLTLRVAVDLAESSTTLFLTVTLAMLMAEIRYLLCSRVELVEDNVSLEKKIGQLQDHIDHMVDNSRQLEHNIEQESSHKLKLLEEYYCEQLKRQESEFQESTCTLKQFWLETQTQQEEEISVATEKLSRSAATIKQLHKTIQLKEDTILNLETELQLSSFKKKQDSPSPEEAAKDDKNSEAGKEDSSKKEKEEAEKSQGENSSSGNPRELLHQRTLSPVIIDLDIESEMPNVEAPQPSPRTASPAVAAPANTGATEGLESEIQRLKEENSSMKRKHDKEVNQIKQDCERQLREKDTLFKKEKEEASKRFAQEKKDLERGLSSDHEKQLQAFQDKKRELEEKLEYEKAELCHAFQMERSDLDSGHKKEIEKMKIQFEAKMMELSAQNDKLTQQLDQVEDKFKMLRLENEQNKAAKGGKMLSAKEPEIPPAVQVELVDLSKQVMRLRADCEKYSRQEEENQIEIQRLRHSEQDLKIEKETLEEKLAVMQKRLRELEEDRNSLASLKSQLGQEASEVKSNHEAEVKRMEEEFDIVKKDMELKFKEELCCEKVKLDELMIAKVELEEKEGELNLEIEQLNKRLSQSDEMHAKEIEAIVVGNVSRKKN
ncbi:uncharacterized protein LOC142339271 [Convolutriloba macropyga]|uniref:uncharacterized protein LOC142339271 n=1 Tax=Convolutriloba macropyga TaxID=536237 RepID=UPI003F51E086